MAMPFLNVLTRGALSYWHKVKAHDASVPSLSDSRRVVVSVMVPLLIGASGTGQAGAALGVVTISEGVKVGEDPVTLVGPDLGDQVAHTVGSAMAAGGLEVTLRVRVCALCHVAQRVVAHCPHSPSGV